MPVHRRPTHPFSLHLLSLMTLFSTTYHAAAQDSGSFDCRFSVGELTYDLSKLGGTKVLNQTRETPPSTYVDELRFDLCADLTEAETRPPEDQCPLGTRACLTIINQKGDGPERITQVIPIAQPSSLETETFALSSPDSVAITFHGAPYPPSSSSPVSQSLRISLTCGDATTEPQFLSYENGQALVEWSSSVACGVTGTPKEDDSTGGGGSGGQEGGTPVENVGSGLGFFFLVLFLALAAYFALGAYYNYSTYGARGWDLIPHRDFWREVPYMLQDVVAHLCSNVRTRRSSRGGYIAV